jgi:ABC-type branched-subunit amino acid transport system substrate-binding protein
MNFKPQVINGGGTAAAAAPAVKAFADSYRGVVNLMYKSWTYCGSDAVGQTALGQFKTRLRAAEAANYDKLNQNFSAQAYDAVYLAKAAIEGAKSVDGEVLTKWIEQNAKSVKNIVSGSLDASPTSHFLLANKEALVFAVDPDKPRADGLFRRAGC